MTAAPRRPARLAEPLDPGNLDGLVDLTDRFGALDLLVVGDAMLDAWMWGPSRGLSREGPVPVVSVTRQSQVPGGAGNAAAAAAGAGAHTRLVGVVGDDPDGRRLRDLLDDAGVAVDAVEVEPGRTTVAKRRICSGSHLHLRCDTGDEGPPRPATAARVAAHVASLVPASSAVLACDYGAGMFSPALIAHVAAAARAAGRRLVVDAHDLTRWASVRPDLVKPNAGEVVGLLPAEARAGFAEDRVGTVERFAADILTACAARVAAVTLDRDGVVLLSADGPPRHVPAVASAPDEQTSGAGDTFVVALVLALEVGADLVAAARLAAVAASVAVSSPGTSVCSAGDLRARLAGTRVVLPVGGAELAGIVSDHRTAGRRIVFTNGCFDVLHAGHIAYLDAARRLGDVLVVGVNSDAGVRRLKGPDRPINGLTDRLAVLTALTGIDHVVVFDEDTPAALLRSLRPDVYVKGGDYTEEMLTEAPLVRELGGEVRIVDYVEDRSTSDLVGRIRRGTAAP